MTKNGLHRIKKTFLASGPAAARNPFRRQKRRTTKFSGWRFGSLVACFEVGICLTFNVLFIVFAVTTSNPQNGIGTLYEGSCETVKNLDTWLHVVLNGLATALIGASNYNMQCLTSPSRQETDTAHVKGVWLDIGIPSIRNLCHIARKRVFLWVLLATSSLPLHLLWNSAIFSTLQNNNYQVFTVVADFLVDGTSGCSAKPLGESNDYADIFCNMHTAALAGMDSSDNLTRLNYHECAHAYGSAIQSEWSNVIAVLKPSVSRDLSTIYGVPSPISLDGVVPVAGIPCDGNQSAQLTDVFASSAHSHTAFLRSISNDRTSKFPSLCSFSSQF